MDNLKALRKTVFFISFPLSFIGFLFPVYAYFSGISVVEVGFMYSAFTLFAIIIRPVVGLFIDKKGRKPGIVLGIAFYCLVNMLFLLGDDFQHLMAARIFQGIASTFLWVSINTAVSDLSHGGNRSETFGILDESINKGDLTGVILGFNLVMFFKGSFKPAFLLYLTTGFISLYCALTGLKETKDLKPCSREEAVRTSRDFNVFLILMGLFAFAFSLTDHTYLIYIADNITDELQLMAYLFFPGAVLSLFLPKRFGMLSDKYGREKILVASIIANGILCIVLPEVKSYRYFLAVHTIMSIFSILKSPAESGLVMDIVGENQRGKNYGKYKFAIGIGGMLGPVAGGYIYENLGSEAGFHIKGIMAVLLCLFAVCYFNRIRQKGHIIKEDTQY